MNYSKIYSSIIGRARQERRKKGQGTYYEAHHIEPLCLGGAGKKSEWRYHSNIVLLTAKEHFVCHSLLVKMYPESKELAYAFWAMCNMKEGRQVRYTPSSKVYEEARNKVSIFLSERKGTFTGKKHTQETKNKQSQAQKGIKKSEEHRANLSKAQKGRSPWNKGKRTGPLSAETREKMRLAKLKKKFEV